jgi:cleavage stimulation factor subunit 3
MAEDEAEHAFFQAQAMNADYDPEGEIHDAGLSDSEGYGPSITIQDNYSASLAEPSNQNDSQEPIEVNGPSVPQSAEEISSTSDAGHVSQVEDPAYPPQTPSRTDSRASASALSSTIHVQPKTRTIGGFVVEDDDDDEDDDEDDKDETEYEPPGVLGGIEDVGPVSENANETVSTSGVSIQPPVPDVASSKDVPNNAASSSHLSSVSFQTGPNVYNVQTQQAIESTDSNAPTPTPSMTAMTAAATRGRLPHDRVGILEDRIKEDPRGDIPAWLELIGEHRSRNRIDSAREVYERFLKVFPSSVCLECSRFMRTKKLT